MNEGNSNGYLVFRNILLLAFRAPKLELQNNNVLIMRLFILEKIFSLCEALSKYNWNQDCSKDNEFLLKTLVATGDQSSFRAISLPEAGLCPQWEPLKGKPCANAKSAILKWCSCFSASLPALWPVAREIFGKFRTEWLPSQRLLCVAYYHCTSRFQSKVVRQLSGQVLATLLQLSKT